jgi:hypothetical protein
LIDFPYKGLALHGAKRTGEKPARYSDKTKKQNEHQVLKFHENSKSAEISTMQANLITN